ncbi:MAG: FixH family protein [Rhodothermales bacterium]
MRTFRFTGLLLLLLVAGCAPDISETEFYKMHPVPGDNASDDVVLIDHVEAGTQLTLVAEEPLGWGFNRFRIEASEGWQSFTPMLVFETQTRIWRSPIEPIMTDDSGVVYAVPPMEDDGTWYLEIDGSTTEGPISLRTPVAVSEDIWVREGDSSDLIVAWVAPTTPMTGNDAFEVAIYRNENGAFVPVTDASLDLYPYMDMGGGEGHSTPYSAPVHTGNGHYRGDVNFIMSGGWDMTVIVTKDGQTENIVFAGFTVKQG